MNLLFFKYVKDTGAGGDSKSLLGILLIFGRVLFQYGEFSIGSLLRKEGYILHILISVNSDPEISQPSNWMTPELIKLWEQFRWDENYKYLLSKNTVPKVSKYELTVFPTIFIFVPLLFVI